jgi:hypothetical protein
MTRHQFILCIVLLSVVVTSCGCAGGDKVPKTATLILAEHRLSINVETDKSTYAVGEPVDFWLSVRNDDTRAHQLALRSVDDQPGGVVCTGLVTNEISSWGEHLRIISNSEQTIKIVQPGQSLVLVEFTWDQKTDVGDSVGSGSYYLRGSVVNVYLDGKQIPGSDSLLVQPHLIQVTE